MRRSLPPRLTTTISFGCVALLSIAVAGCGSDARQSKKTTDPGSEQSADTDQGGPPKISVKRTDDLAPGVQDRIRSGTLGSGSSSFTQSLAGSKAIERLSDSLRESLQTSPATVVWLWDVSDNCQPFGDPIRVAARQFYESLEESPPDNPLSTGMLTFGEDIDMPLGEAMQSPQEVIKALDAITFDGGESQLTFAAFETCIDRFLDSTRAAGNDLLVVCITNEAGSDLARVDDVCDRYEDAGVPVYVIGIPAPFGLVGNEPRYRVEAARSGLECGPESYAAERIRLEFPPNTPDTMWLDSGFGSWGLERLCRVTGGRYLIVRDAAGRFSGGLMGSEWPSLSAKRFPDQTMSKYKPEYVSSEEYERRTESNAARAALHRAAQLEPTNALQYVTLEFDGTNPAQLSTATAQAQRESAAVIPDLELLRTTLQAGEAERESLTNPRLQAGFDLAMGRAYAALTRADGYNNMLAELKRGRNFSDPANDTWVLTPTDEFTTGGSRLKTGLRKATEYLQRVIDEHPDTPWAYLAEQELKTPIGWQWTEEDRQP